MIVQEKQKMGSRAQSPAAKSRQRVLGVLLGAAGALSLALAGQWLVQGRQAAQAGVAAFGLAIILFLRAPLAAGRVTLSPAMSPASPAKARPFIRSQGWRLLLGASALMLAALSYQLFSGNRLLPGLW